MPKSYDDFEILLGFDFGMKRIGVAVGQAITQSATPLTTIHANAGVPDWNSLTKLLQEWKPQALVVGIPLNMDGTDQPITEDAKNFALELKSHFKIPTFGMDERLSTKDARDRVFQAGGYKKLQSTEIDAVAAQLILEHWLSSPHEGYEIHE